jgi:hypothetical protein
LGTSWVGNIPVDSNDFRDPAKYLTELSLVNSPVDISESCTPALKVGSLEPYDLSQVVDANKLATLTVKNDFSTAVSFKVVFYDVVDITAVTSPEVVLAINTAVGVDGIIEAIDDSGAVSIKSNGALGSNAEMVLSGNLATAVGVDGTTYGIGTPSVFEIRCDSFDAKGVAGVGMAVKVYDVSTAGSLLPECYIQRVSKGAFVTGEGTNSAVINTGGGGECVFEVVSDIAGIDSLFVEIKQDPLGGFAKPLTDRVQVDKLA